MCIYRVRAERGCMEPQLPVADRASLPGAHVFLYIKYIEESQTYNQINLWIYVLVYMAMGWKSKRVHQMPPYSQVLGFVHPKYS